ncbi:replisome organizer [Agathobacter rectalis]|uniref:replisome organizer n=1 Tax=Agathobacter rectalis TaxID=39491 RepID=UPI002684EC5C|nr:replisome organizer [Agathobacter rectalis]
MAERRMFAKKITESDAFLDMPSSTQMLYFHLSMNADDDGFVNNPKKIQRMCGASDDDFKLLIAKSFVILFESGIIVIKHWKMHNYIQSDRYRPTDYVDEKSMLGVKKNKAYTLDESKMYTKCIQDVSVGKDSIGKVSIDKNSIVKDSKGESVRGEKTKHFIPPSVEEVEQYCLERSNNIDAQSFIDFYESKGWMIGKNKMKDWKAAVRTWERSRKQENKENVFDEWRNA